MVMERSETLEDSQRPVIECSKELLPSGSNVHSRFKAKASQHFIAPDRSFPFKIRNPWSETLDRFVASNLDGFRRRHSVLRPVKANV